MLLAGAAPGEKLTLMRRHPEIGDTLCAPLQSLSRSAPNLDIRTQTARDPAGLRRSVPCLNLSSHRRRLHALPRSAHPSAEPDEAGIVPGNDIGGSTPSMSMRFRKHSVAPSPGL